MPISPVKKMQGVFLECFSNGHVTYRTLFDILEGGNYLMNFHGKRILSPRLEVREYMEIIHRWSSHERFCVALYYMYMTYLGKVMVEQEAKKLRLIFEGFKLGRKN